VQVSKHHTTIVENYIINDIISQNDVKLLWNLQRFYFSLKFGPSRFVPYPVLFRYKALFNRTLTLISWPILLFFK
jgi:hypothetical protein